MESQLSLIVMDGRGGICYINSLQCSNDVLTQAIKPLLVQEVELESPPGRSVAPYNLITFSVIECICGGSHCPYVPQVLSGNIVTVAPLARSFALDVFFS